MEEKNRSTLEERVTSKACSGAVKVSTTGSGRRDQTGDRGGATYLLLDVVVGDINGTRGSVEEVLVGGHLTGLHWSPSPAQLLHGNKVKQ